MKTMKTIEWRILRFLHQGPFFSIKVLRNKLHRACAVLYCELSSYLDDFVACFKYPVLPCRTIFWNFRDKNSLQETKKIMNFATTSEKVTKYFAPKQKFNDRKNSNGWSECDQTWSSLLPRHFPYKESNLFHRQYWFQGLCCSGGSCIQSAEERTILKT